MLHVGTRCAVMFERLSSWRHSVFGSKRGSEVTPMWRRSPKLALLLIGVIAAGCAQTKSFFVSDGIQPLTSEVRVVLMPPDIELYVLTASGMLEPKAEWTAKARLHVIDALKEELRAKNVQLLLHQTPTDMPSQNYEQIQLLKLHEAVGRTILKHKYISQFALPTKKDKFDWTLGEGATVLREESDAQYGLFIQLRDSYTSTGRAVAIFLAAALFGVGIPGGQQVGFASLVDLHNGDILWFNRLISGTGDLRTPEPARKAVKQLLTELPL